MSTWNMYETTLCLRLRGKPYELQTFLLGNPNERDIAEATVMPTKSPSFPDFEIPFSDFWNSFSAHLDLIFSEFPGPGRLQGRATVVINARSDAVWRSVPSDCSVPWCVEAKSI